MNTLKSAFVFFTILSLFGILSTNANAETNIPKWLDTAISWYERGLITVDDLKNSLEYLDRTRVIDLDSDDFDDILQKPEYDIKITEGKKHIIPLDKIKSGGPPKDGIPSIDHPKFAKIHDSQFVSDSDTVIGLEIDGDARAYPLFILVWHEIVNDTVGGVPVAVTYCPLCYTNQVFERVIDGKEVEFGHIWEIVQQ